MKQKAGYQISATVSEGILELVITGEVTEDMVQKLTDEVFAIIREKNTATLLVDVRSLKGRFGLGETYFRVRNYPPDRPRTITAVVDIQEHAAYESFHEIAATNAGLNMKWFTDINDARAWLKSVQ